MTQIVKMSKKLPSYRGVSVSFRLDDDEKERLDALCEKHNLDKHVFLRNAVIDHICGQELEDSKAESDEKPKKDTK